MKTHAAPRPPVSTSSPAPRAGRFGPVVAVATGVLTVLTFALALTALPDKVPYPFTAGVIAAQWPGDYLWMYPAMVLMVLFVALVAALHQHAEAAGRVSSLLALILAAMSATVLLLDYWIQVSVMPLSLEKGQLDGWSMFTQNNPNGIFIALEELGYVLMSLVFLALVPALSRQYRSERIVRRVFMASPAAVLVSLVVVSALHGRDRGDVFEILVISIVWLTLIGTAPLLASTLRRATPSEQAPS